MHPILFQFGGVAVQSYSVLLDAGILAGLALAFWRWRRLRLPAVGFLDLATWILLGGLIFGRLVYVIVNWTFFQDHLAEIVTVWSGGLSFHGAFAGGLLALVLYAGAARRLLAQLLDLTAAALALGAIFGWLACYAAGSNYGVAGQGWLFLPAPDIYGLVAPRFALQLVSAGASLAILVLLVFLLELRARAGVPFASFLILYFGAQFVVEFLRGDESLFVGTWRLAQVADAAAVVAGVVLLIALRNPQTLPAPEPLAVAAPAEEPPAEQSTEEAA